jgi:hypothetical protein
MARPIHVIAREVRADWKNIYFGAVPYLDAMNSIGGIHERYFNDSAASVVRYFLSNATNWRGDKARQIKAELKAMLKDV